MKTREEQIAEMAKEMRNYGYKHLCAGRVFYYGFCENLYDAGYRKQSDTVREFVERLKQSLIDLYPEKNEKISLPDLEIDGIDIEMTINKLATEYGAEVEE